MTAFASVDPQRLPLWGGMPRRWIGGFMIAGGVVTLAVWLIDPVAALVAGEPPATLETHTTLFTHALDLAVIAPTAVASGLLIVRARRLGYLLAASLLVLEALLLPLIAIATVVQVRMGLSFTTAEVVGPIAGFATIALQALWALATMLRHVRERPRAA